MTGCLPDVRVLDMSRMLAGPWAGQLLADFGADVVKVEPSWGDEARQSGAFTAANRGKRSIVIDVATEAGQAVMRGLVAKADVLIEAHDAGGLMRFGLDYATLSVVNPRLVYCSVTGFGRTGPYAGRAGFDPVLQAMSGLMSVTGGAPGTAGAGPAPVGYGAPEINAGFYAALAIMAALHHRDVVSGRGQLIDLAILDSQIAAHSHVAMDWLASGMQPERLPVQRGMAAQVNTPWQAFEAADRPLMVAVGDDRMFAAFCGVIGLAEVPGDERYASNAGRMAHVGTLVPLIEGAMAAQTAQSWMEALEAAGVPSGAINDFGAVAADPHVAARAMLLEFEGEPMVANPVRFSGSPVTYRRGVPALGADTAGVLQDWLGLVPE